MAWNYKRDKSLLSDKAAEEALSVCMKFNGFMALNDDNIRMKEGLKSTVDFLELCKQKINEAIDKKIEDVKARAK